MARRRATSQSTVPIELWELDLVSKVARAFRTTEREELEAELAKRLCELKSKNLSGIRNWRGYVAKFLYNKASNIVRSWRLRDKRERIQEPPERWTAATTENQNIAFDFARLWRSLNPELRQCWHVLIEEGGNQGRTARRLGKHRNTVRRWIREIRTLFEKHGFGVS